MSPELSLWSPEVIMGFLSESGDTYAISGAALKWVCGAPA